MNMISKGEERWLTGQFNLYEPLIHVRIFFLETPPRFFSIDIHY